MFAQLIVLLVLLASVLAGNLPAWAEVSLDQVLSALGVPTEITLPDGRTLTARLQDGRVIYGGPEDVSGAEPAQGFRDGQWRYLGYTYTGDPFSNMDFPPDALVTRRIDRQWVQNPWLPPYKLCTRNPDTIPASSWDLILRGLRGQARYREDPLPDYVLEALDRYANVLCPPVAARLPDGTWVTTGGAVRMWHAGGAWYETFFIDPLEFLNEKPNLYVRNLTLDPNPASPGGAVAARAEIVNEGSQDVTTVARWIFNDRVVTEQEVTIPAGGYNVTQARIQAPQEPRQYAVGVLANPNHDRPANEKTYDDNYAEGYLTVEEPCVSVGIEIDRGMPKEWREGRSVWVVGVVRYSGGAPDEVRVRVDLGGARSGSHEIVVPRGGSRQVGFELKGLPVGTHSFTLTAEPLGRPDCDPSDNSASVTVRVVPGPSDGDQADLPEPGDMKVRRVNICTSPGMCPNSD